MPKLNYLEVAGSPFDAGRTLGQFGAAAMHSYARESTAWATVMRHRGSALVNEMADLVRSRFPRVWEELQGMATGLELPFDDVFLWNCRGDLWAMAPDGCTTVQQPGTVRRITHNEDGDPAFAGHCGIVSYAVDGGVPLASFVYPGSIPGHTFAVTQSGLAMTVNNLRCLDVEAGMPRMVLVRALLDTASIDDALELLRGNKRAGGFHLTLAHASTQSLLSVEFSSEMCSVIEIASQSLHANHALHPPALMHAQIVTGSSKHRQRRGDTLLSGARNAADPLEILSDRGDADFPILRTDPQDSDGENTMATADIHVGPERIEWWVHEAPSEPARFHMIGVHATENRSEPCTPLD